MTRTGRPRGFDERHVVSGAKDMFWRRGYAAVSLRELATELGVLPGSLYAALGNKHDLYLRALHDYVEDTRAAAAALASQRSPLAAVRTLLGNVLDAAVTDPGRGCMLGNTAAELLPNDESARKIVRSGLHVLETGIEQALREAQRAGEIRDDIDCAARADLLVVLLQGLHITARAESEPHRLHQVIDTMLDSMTSS
ncbi:TetR/AcrR family transcriptional repressor of nem operon [Prauserella sediminis]|uniref:TetR/AcrR family transcriptional repressor of nem operon n=1 Tax=Prauserella sediminis TaxID=577680 RepID=A0A839Y2T1_9PSEU|nr:TetR/AcrR family transcriptional regulator [Prauserella sediminis]MBB3666225.1 TetR/AcrR family transcriptional repressor of nem operon [Prauserella sediminis]